MSTHTQEPTTGAVRAAGAAWAALLPSDEVDVERCIELACTIDRCTEAPALLAAAQEIGREIRFLVKDGTLVDGDVVNHPAMVALEAAIAAATA